MKQTVFVLIVAASVFLVACRENVPTEPKSSPQILSKPKPVLYRIPFYDVLSHHAIDAEQLFDVQGTIHYTMEVQDFERWSVVQLNIAAEGQLTPHQQVVPLWGFGGSSYDEVIVSQESDTFIEKRYSIVGSDVGLSLRMRFHVRRNGIQRSGMWLESHNSDLQARSL